MISGNVSIGGHCIFDQQCKGSPNTAMCSNDQTCRCGSGYIAIQQHCLKGMFSRSALGYIHTFTEENV